MTPIPEKDQHENNWSLNSNKTSVRSFSRFFRWAPCWVIIDCPEVTQKAKSKLFDGNSELKSEDWT